MRRIVIPLIFGLAGAAMLVALGLWQLRRLDEKQAVIAAIEARIDDAPAALPATLDPERDRYQPVELRGTLEAETLRVLVSQKRVGAGYRLISALDTGQRRVLVDRGFVPVQADMPDLAAKPATVSGNLHWPDDRNSSTPDNDVAGNIWFARDIRPMADALDTEPLLVIARSIDPADPGLDPLPVSTRGIPNDHQQYVVTWFSLAAIWLGMTGYFLWRTRRPTQGLET